MSDSGDAAPNPNQRPKGGHPGKPARGEGDHGALPDALENSHALTELAHELSGLIDGSMRCLRLAVRTFPAGAHEASAAQVDTAKRQMETAVVALERMFDAIRKAMGPYRTGLGARLGGPPGAVTLEEAASHAVDVLRLSAAEARATLEMNADESVGAEPAGVVYPLLLNGLRNAIDAVAVTGAGGRVTLGITGDGLGNVLIAVTDDGCGLPGDSGDLRLFERGFSTKPEGSGIGLGICKSVVDELGGTIELVSRPDGERGAVLRVEYAAAKNRTDHMLPPGKSGDIDG